MNRPDSPSKIIGVLFVIAFLAGCAAPTTPPSLPPTSAPPAVTNPTLPPPPNPTLPPPPTPAQPVQPTGQASLFRFVQTVQVTPDANFLIGGFARVGYVPATDRLVVTFGTRPAQPTAGCTDNAHAYKEFTLEMEATGNSGVLNCEAGDSAGVMVDNSYYDVSMHPLPGSDGWRIVKYDAVTWATLADIQFPLDSPREGNGDPMVAFVNGQLDVSAGWTEAGGPPAPGEGGGTHHQFFTPDLQFISKQILTDTPHIGGSSMIYVDGIYYFVTASAYTGDLIMMKYDQNWQYLGTKNLISHAHWPTGIAFDGQRFYVAYLDTSQNTSPGFFPYYPNVHLAAFDREWNLVDDVAVTSFAPSDLQFTGRPWVLLHGNRLYVSYDVVPLPEDLTKIEAYVSVYELTGQPGGQPAQPTQPAINASACSESDLSPVGVLQSTDHGASWTSLGNACIRGLNIPPADPTGFVLDGRVVLYFVDLGHLDQPVPQVIYRTTSTDGVNFEALQPAYTQDSAMVDPFVLPMPDGTFRLYVPSGDEGIISALSSDGITFTREQGVRTRVGGMPGALALPDNRVRLFLAGNGISSEISTDGLSFTQEGGLRIPAVESAIVDNPQPIRLMDGSYLMLFSVHDLSHEGQPEPWTYTEIRLASSTDAYDWIVNPAIIGYGGTSCVVEMPDGRLYIYYGTANP